MEEEKYSTNPRTEIENPNWTRDIVVIKHIQRHEAGIQNTDARKNPIKTKEPMMITCFGRQTQKPCNPPKCTPFPTFGIRFSVYKEP
jgi:hypothetical protein